MKTKRKVWVAIAALTVAGVALAGCSSNSGGSSSNASASSSSSSGASTAGFDAASTTIVNPSTKQGGTLNLYSSADCDSWDPARTYYGWCWNMQRLFTRTLVGYQTVNNAPGGYKLAPDLATALGQHNADYTEWTYTLKPGLKYSTGAAITPMDIKYGIERLYATDVINGGPNFYFTELINAPASYTGPYKDGDLPDTAISTTSNSITFHLKSSYADFDYLMALDASAPVPYKVEGGSGFVGQTYTKHPASSGPFEIQSYTPNVQITFVRNPNWSQSTDTIRHPLVDKVVMTIDSQASDIDNKLQDGTADANASYTVGSAFQSKIMTTPSLKANADDPAGPSDDFLTVYPSVVPNQECRAAIFYATNKAALLQAMGGPTAGVIANSMTPPGLQGYDASSNMYPTGSDSTGDLKAAKQALQKCGQPDGFTTKMAYQTNRPTWKAVFLAEQAALARVGIKLVPTTADGSTYYSTFIGSPANVKSQGIGMSMNGWAPDFPTGYGFYNSIANGNAILPTGNSNYPSLNDPTVNSVLAKSVAGTATNADWESLDNAIMKTATYLPFAFQKNLYYRNPRLTNVTSNVAQAYGIYDFVNVGVGG